LFVTSLVGVLAACGKRGDPLPPLRPVPDVAEQVSVEQIGDQLRLEWKAPARNHDGTTENLDLREARVLRRVLDLDALVKAQTHPAPTESEQKSEKEPTSGETPPEVATDRPPGEAAPAAEPEPSPEPAPVAPSETPPREADAATSTTTEKGEPPTPQAPPTPPTPRVTFPPFEGEAVVVATLTSTEPGAPGFYEEPVDREWIGKRVEYALVYTNRKKRVSPVSAKVQIDPVPALAPPGAPTAEGGEGFVSLSWTPPATGTETGTDIGYLVFRHPGTPPPPSEAEHPVSPLGEEPVSEPLSEPAFEDHAIVFGVPVCYRVATVLLPPPLPPPENTEETETETERETVEEMPPGDIVPIVPPIAKPPRIQSLPSDEVCLTPEDHFPPPVPTGLVVVPSGDGLLLTWRGVEAGDLRGYRVYGASSASGPFQLLGEVETPTYTDPDAPVGEARFYAVTAIDTAPGTNESKRSDVASATRRQ
jgi:hypothetical protein